MSCMHCSCPSRIPMGAEQSAASTIFQCSLSKQSVLLVEFFQYLKWHVFVEIKVSHQYSQKKFSTASCAFSHPSLVLLTKDVGSTFSSHLYTFSIERQVDKKDRGDICTQT